MAWIVEFAEEFVPELDKLKARVKEELLAHAQVLAQLGPHLGRPLVDTLKGSRHANMKELRFQADGGVWRVAFAFDPRRHGILLVAGDKARTKGRRFYEQLIEKADRRFDLHLERQES